MIKAQRSSLPISFLISICTFGTASVAVNAQIIKPAKSPDISSSSSTVAAKLLQTPSQTSSARPITVSDAVSIFLRQNFQLIAARYDIDTAEAEKLTARLRPNPEVTVGFEGVPLNFSGNLLAEQQISAEI